MLGRRLVRGFEQSRATEHVEFYYSRAILAFVENDIRALPIVNDLTEKRVLGMITRTEITSAYLRFVHGPRAAKAVR